ncbi:MAG: lecithin retinol acyltransferase family protein [Solirubrobacterales bacterium]
MAYGDHIYVDRGGYEHHGIDLGDGTVIHRHAPNGTKNDSLIRLTTLDTFTKGGAVEIRAYGIRPDPDEVVARARSMLGQPGYDLVFNNCEHFATWCVTGERSSAQVETVASGTGVIGVGVGGPSIGRNVVVGMGQTAPMSAPNLMSGLSRIGGGSAVNGIALLGATSGLLAAGTMCVALRDKPYLTEEERQARRVGRHSAIGGAGLGVGISLYAVHALGVPGYSAAGLSSGLAELGGILGGGMARGVTLTLLLPALFAVLIGYALYRLSKKRSQTPQRLRAAEV